MHRLVTATLLLAGAALLVCSPAAGEGEPSEPAPPAAEEGEGDVITFKSGKQLKGMQIIRETARSVLVQVLDDLEPMVLSKKFIERIDYDDISPRRGAAGTDGQDEPDVVVAVRLSGEMHRHLNTPLPPSLLRSQGEDYLTVLRRLSRAARVPMEISESARARPVDQRTWKYSAEPGTSLERLLRDKLLTAFQDLRVLYNYDKLVVTTSEAGSPEEAS